MAFFFDFCPKVGPSYNARLSARIVALSFSIVGPDTLVGLRASCLRYFKAAVISSAVVSVEGWATSPFVDLERLPSSTLVSELLRERDRFGIDFC